jgi:hypothetical protein
MTTIDANVIDEITEEIARINEFARALEAELDMSFLSQRPVQNTEQGDEIEEDDDEADDGIEGLCSELQQYTCHLSIK